MKKRILMSLILSASTFLAPSIYADTASSNSFTPEQTTQIQKIVHDYLVKNPQVLVEVATALQNQQLAQQNQQAMKALPDNAKALFYDQTSPVVGNPNGNVTVVEFFDYQCPHCKNAAIAMNKLLASDNNVRIVYKQLPIFGANSEYAARAALAANEQGKFVELHNALMKAQSSLNKDLILNIASNLGINIEKLQKDMNTPVINNELKRNFDLANAFNFPGTPAFVIARIPVGQAATNAAPPSTAYFLPGEVSAQDLQKYVSKARGG